jgi:hypothetical protein
MLQEPTNALQGYIGRLFYTKTTNEKQTLWPLVRERAIPTERPPLVNEI